MFSSDRGIGLRQEQFMYDRQTGGSTPKPRAIQETAPPPVQEEDVPELVLYVWGDEKNSEKAMALAERRRALDHFTVVDVRTLNDDDIAPWLTGVPTLLSVGTKEVFRGTKCLDAIGTFVPPAKSPQQTRNNIPPQMMTIPQPQMNRNTEGPSDVDSLPRFREPENESEKEKQDLKSQVEAIMARREAMVGSKES